VEEDGDAQRRGQAQRKNSAEYFTTQRTWLVLMASSTEMLCEACKKVTHWRYDRSLDNRKTDAKVEHVWRCKTCGTHIPFQPAFG